MVDSARSRYKTQEDIQKHIALLVVERMLTPNRQLITPTTDQERTLFERQITATDQQIDQLVYTLYAISRK